MPQGAGYSNKSLHDALASRGRNGDTMVAHINPQEAQLLKNLGGSGTRNPDTGLPEFFLDTVSSIADIAGTGASIYGSFAGAQAANERADQRQQLIDRSTDLSDRQIASQLGTRIDARGNVVEYDEGTNTWQVVPSPTTEQIIRAQDEETLAQLTIDAARNRRAAGRAEDIAQTSLPGAMQSAQNVTAPDQYTREGVESILRQDALQGVNEAFEDANLAASRTMARTGGDPTGNTFADLAEERADANQDARLSSARQALGLASDLNAQAEDRARANLSSLSQAATGGVSGFSGENISGRLSSALQSRGSGSLQAGAGNALNATQAVSPSGEAFNIAGGIAGIAGLTNQVADMFGRNNDNNTSAQQRRRSGNTNSGSFTLSEAPGLRF